MTTQRWILTLFATTALSVIGTVFVGAILEDEAPVVGAIPGHITSATLGEDREYFVHLPEDYTEDSTAHYPVMYVLDGTSQSGHTAESAAILARVGLVPPIIVVGVPSLNTETRNRDYTPPEMRLDNDASPSLMGKADHFLTFLQMELVPRIETDYRTAHPRMLSGWSRGGLFVVYSELAVPDFFDARFAHSPALWRENDVIVDRLRQQLTRSPRLTGFLYLSLGDKENQKMTQSYQHAVQILQETAPPTLRWRADLSQGGVHETNARLSTPVGLCVLFRAKVAEDCRQAGPTDGPENH